MKRVLWCVLLVGVFVGASCASSTPPTALPSTSDGVSPTISSVPPTRLPTVVPTPTVPPDAFPLSGLPVEDPGVFDWPPVAVMIPSDSEQYGLSQASVVYEVVMEQEIPRFLAIYEHMDAEQIGPIRSARPYTVEWACPYGALFVHWGGSPQSLSLLAQLDCLANLEGMTYEGGYFWRGPVQDVPWNNVYTSSDLLRGYLENWEMERFAEYRGYPHKDDAPLGSRPLSGTVSFAFSDPVCYTYDRGTNSYLREYKGQPHLDLLTGEPLRVRNLALIFVPQGRIPGDPEGRMEMDTVGEGEALVFLDGTLIEGRWERPAVDGELRFFDGAGREVAFNRGNIWIEVLAPGHEVEIALGRPVE